jgi:methyl-accepting chemotaxis protein
MNWFKNLNAMPRLMSSFGVLMVLTLAISSLAIYNLSTSNARLSSLYEDDMTGSRQANQMAKDRLSLGREARQAILNIQDDQIVAAEHNSMLALFTDIHKTLDGADKSFYSKEGQEIIGELRTALPIYESGYQELYAKILAKDTVGSMAALAKVTQTGAPFMTGTDRAVEIKVKRGEEKYLANIESYNTTRGLMIGTCLLSLVLGVLLSIFIARGFSVPLGKAVETLERVADGDLTVSLDVHTQDEVGRMAMALNRAVEKLNSTMQEVADSAGNASSSSQQLAAASEAIASGAQEQAASLEETSASLEEITATVRQSADNAQQASQLATGSKDSALQGQEVVSKAITAMSEINQASAKISDIISTIDEIAFQTNLLAVNAAVEAARAGDEGRGFAVVASEVRSLAQRSAVAAKEIKVLIQDSLRKVEAGSALVNRSGETLQGIVGSVKRVTDIVSEIAAASREQTAGIEQVNSAMTQMDQVTQGNSAQTEELSATAEALSEQASHLLQLVSTFTLANSAKSHREPRAYQSPVAAPVRSVQPPSLQQLKSAVRPLAKAVRSSMVTKPSSGSRSSKRTKSQDSILAVAVPSGSTADDASFQEF